MVRTYKKTPGTRAYKSYTEDQLEEALEKITDEELSIHAASLQYKIPFGTLYNRYKGLHSRKVGGQTVFTHAEEKALLRAAATCSDWGFPLTSLDLRMIAKAYLDKQVKYAKNVARALQIQFEKGVEVTLEDCWLRDHCRCSSCYHSDTFQRANHLLETPEVTINKFQYDKSEIFITWSDNHESTYLSSFLIQFHYKTWMNSRRLKPILWEGIKVADRVARVAAESFLSSKEGSRKVFQSLLDFGVALIEGVEPSVEATEKVCKALGGIQHTLFGGMWEFTTRPDHADMAYTNLPQAVHNDNTYFTEAAGLQILHCLKHLNAVGGETILVDGFYGANRLKEECPESFEFLSTFELEAEFIEEGHHHRHAAPVITVDRKNDDLKQIRFNVYDRSPMPFQNSLECRTYYRSLRKLAKYYEDPEYQWRFKLQPGVVMVMDNFRVLHGRTAFAGERVLCGCYVSRSDWLDRTRVLGLLQ